MHGSFMETEDLKEGGTRILQETAYQIREAKKQESYLFYVPHATEK